MQGEENYIYIFFYRFVGESSSYNILGDVETYIMLTRGNGQSTSDFIQKNILRIFDI
jgi:hypothetical protein